MQLGGRALLDMSDLWEKSRTLWRQKRKAIMIEKTTPQAPSLHRYHFSSTKQGCISWSSRTRPESSVREGGQDWSPGVFRTPWRRKAAGLQTEGAKIQSQKHHRSRCRREESNHALIETWRSVLDKASWRRWLPMRFRTPGRRRGFGIQNRPNGTLFARSPQRPLSLKTEVENESIKRPGSAIHASKVFLIAQISSAKGSFLNSGEAIRPRVRSGRQLLLDVLR